MFKHRHRYKIPNLTIQTQQFRNRLLIISGFILVFAALLIARLFYLQVIAEHTYATLSRKNIVALTSLPPNRGLIFDRNGILLAKNIPRYALMITPKPHQGIHPLIEQLRTIIPISTDEVNRFQHIRHHYHPYQPIPLKYKLSEKQVASFYVNRYRFPNVHIQADLQRFYPLNALTSHVIGYTGLINETELQQNDANSYNSSDSIGKSGIEKYYEKNLRGHPGVLENEINASGQIIRGLKKTPAQPGENLYLTIDTRLQQAADRALGKNNGAIVALDPNNGEILALVSKPSFDPNVLINATPSKAYQQLLSSPEHPLYNRAIRGQFAPGSTIKPFYALQSLDHHVITPNETIYDPGWFRLPGTLHTYHDWRINGHGLVDVRKAIMVSCDVFFYRLAVKNGIDNMQKMLQRFGFGLTTGVDLPGELTGVLPSRRWKMATIGQPWYIGDSIETGIGQGYLAVTPIQLAYAAASLATRGKSYQPHLLLKRQLADGTNMINTPIQRPSLVLKNPRNWNIVISAMQSVINHRGGTARFFEKSKNFMAAGKTGTAQIYGRNRDEEKTEINLPKKLRNNHLFIGFAPVHHPSIVVAVIVEHAAKADRIASRVINTAMQIRRDG